MSQVTHPLLYTCCVLCGLVQWSAASTPTIGSDSRWTCVKSDRLMIPRFAPSRARSSRDADARVALAGSGASMIVSPAALDGWI